jgi:glycosyltransferase involved in cell wall biosynthesis
MIRVTHIITGLAPQGAEAMLYKLVLQMDRSGFANEIISLTNWHEGYADWKPVSDQLAASGIQVRALGMRRGILSPRELLRLRQWIRASKPDVVNTWMYHANLVGGVLARLAKAPVIWGIHHTNLDPRQNKRHTIWTARACARLSDKIPIRIICCSESARRVHADYGYAARKLMVIPNGFDLNYFRPDPQARGSLRRELGIAQGARLVGVAARFHALKGHRNFVEAAARLNAVLPDAHFALCGRDVDWNNSQLAAWIRAAGPGLRAHCHLLGVRQDMPRFFSALDIATSPSMSEAFPSAVGEAMACGTPCVVTDVGDSAVLVGDTGKVVPSGDPKALSEAWLELLNCDPVSLSHLGAQARQRIQERFAVGLVVERYQQTYREVAGQASNVTAAVKSPVDTAGESATEAAATAGTSTRISGQSAL